MNNKKLLHKKIDGFINKYYKSKLIKGVILFFSSSLILLIIISTTEYIGKLETEIRTFMFWFYVCFNMFIIVKYILNPVFKILKLQKTISENIAAKIIGSHFEKIKDKLINYIELENIEPGENALLEASINQKITELEKFSFREAITFNENKKFIKYLLIPLVFGLILLLLGGINILTEGTKRVILYSHEKNSFAPFKFKLLNKKLNCPKHEDFTIKVKIEGKIIPKECFVEVTNSQKYKMKKLPNKTYEYSFKNLQENMSFRLLANGYYSDKKIIKVYKSPELIGFFINVKYPKHINRKSKKIKNTGNIKVPAGSILTWSFDTKNTELINLSFNNDSVEIKSNNTYTRQIENPESYYLTLKNSNTEMQKIKYNIEVIKDQYPEISVIDTLITNKNIVYFNGVINDDYGFSSLSFYHSNLKEVDFEKINLKIKKDKIYQSFEFSFKTNPLKDSIIDFYFEVTDNDFLNGGKKTKTIKKQIQLISEKELQKLEDKINQEINKEINHSRNKSSNIEENVSKIKNSLVSQAMSLWEKRQNIKHLQQEYEDIKKSLEEINKKLKQKTTDLMTEAEKEKLLALQNLLDKIIDEEIKKMLEKINEMMNEENEKNMMNDLKKIEKNKEQIDKELDRYKELFKQLEFEEKFQDILNKIESLSKEQKQLNEKNKENEDFEKIEEKQKDLKKEFENITKDLKKLEELNDSLSKPNKLENTLSKEEEILKEMENSLNELQKQMRQKSQESQEKAQKKIEELFKKLNSSKSQMQIKATYENIENLRQLLDNLIILSFNQEDLIYKTKEVNKNDPVFVTLMEEQKNIFDNSRMIQDSLFELSKRVIQIQSIVNKEIEEMNFNLSESIKNLEERRINLANEKQQYVMTSANNLALLLSDVLLQMQQALSKMTDGEKMCNNPNSKGKGSISNIKGLQNGIKKQLDEMIKKGKKNKGKNGEKTNEKLMKMAGEQEFLRLKLSELMQKISGEKETKKILKEIEEMMKQNEKDLINNNINNVFMIRQNKIKTRLLQAEKAIKEQDYEEKRNSKEWSKKENYDIEKEILIEKLKKENLEEKIHKITPSYSDFYRKKIINYFNKNE